MVTCEVARLSYYGVEVKKEDMYDLHFPTIRFSAGLFLRVCCREKRTEVGIEPASTSKFSYW